MSFITQSKIRRLEIFILGLDQLIWQSEGDLKNWNFSFNYHKLGLMPESLITNKTKINDLIVAQLVTNYDDRGSFTEVFRSAWFDFSQPIQWNIVNSNPGTFRGFHVHKLHADYLTIANGECRFFLKDLRKDSSTFLQEEEIIIKAEQMQGIYIPPGVAHAFYFPVPSIHVYSVTEYWNLADELGFNFQESQLGFNLQQYQLKVSLRDESLGSLDSLLAELAL